MRSLRSLVAVLAALVLLPAAAAQGGLPAPALSVDFAELPQEPVEPGNSTTLSFVFTRRCPNPTFLYDMQTLEVALMARDSNWTIAGPTQGVFPQQVCAQQMDQSITLAYDFHLAAGSALHDAHVDPFVLKARALQASPTTPGTPEQMVPFTVATAAAPPPPVVEEEPERESPGAGPLLLMAALGLAALALRRRR